MHEQQGAADEHSSAEPYEICLQGHLDGHWRERFKGLSLRHNPGGVTTLLGPVVDQAALHGLLRTVRNLGLTLLSVRRLTSTPVNGPQMSADTDGPPGRERSA